MRIKNKMPSKESIFWYLWGCFDVPKHAIDLYLHLHDRQHTCVHCIHTSVYLFLLFCTTLGGMTTKGYFQRKSFHFCCWTSILKKLWNVFLMILVFWCILYCLIMKCVLLSGTSYEAPAPTFFNLPPSLRPPLDKAVWSLPKIDWG